MRVELRRVAFARSGDKGDTANIGLIAMTESVYSTLIKEVTTDRVKEYFRFVCRGEVERFELPNLFALNFLLHQSLGGGGTVSLMLDAQGKTFGAALLGMEVDVPEPLLEECERVLRGEEPGRPGRIGTRAADESGAPAGQDTRVVGRDRLRGPAPDPEAGSEPP